MDRFAGVYCSLEEMPSNGWSSGFDSYQNWSSFAYGYELTGDPLFLERALEQFGSTGDLWIMLRNGGTNNIQNRAALVSLMQHVNGLL